MNNETDLDKTPTMRDQEIRACALHEVGVLFAPAGVSGGEALDLAERFAEWIKTGKRSG